MTNEIWAWFVGTAQHLIKKGEKIIIIDFELTDKSPETKLVLVDKDNKFIRYI